MPTASELKAKRSSEKEEQLQAALKAVTESGVKANGRPNYSLRAAADDFGVAPATLTARWKGRETRRKSHISQQILSPPQEDVLVAWVKELGRRGVPVSLEALAEHASNISEKDVSLKWGRRFRERHPDLKARWTTNLEACRANALNPALVAEFFAILREIYSKFGITLEVVWNMDEKGVVLGVGGRTLVLVDRDQKTVNQVQDGNREMVTMIETVCADGNSLPPMSIFKGKTRNLEWGRQNPGKASISFSENGWTDMELGFLWLQRHFEPLTRPADGRWRLLILDGHNSHGTFKFCQFAATHKVIVVCLPPHTTHRLQPCDVGVFGPLASSWKKEVTLLSGKYIKVTKNNLLYHYHNARQRAFSPSTIQTAFRKTGIWPLDPSVIEPSAFAPSLNTTTQSAMPISASGSVPSADFNQTHSPEDGTIDGVLANAQGPLEQPGLDPAVDDSLVPPSETVLAFARPNPLPLALPQSASRSALRTGYTELYSALGEANKRIEADHAHKKLMDAENESLRKQLFDSRERARTKRKEGGSSARHMTSDENLGLLAFADWKAHLVNVHKEAAGQFKLIRKVIDDQERAAAKERETATRDAERAERDARRELERQEKAAEKERQRDQREEAAAQKRAEAEEDRARKRADAEKKKRDAEEQKVREKAEKAARKSQEKADREAAKRALKEEKAAQKARRSGKKRASDNNSQDENCPPKRICTLGIQSADPAEQDRPVNAIQLEGGPGTVLGRHGLSRSSPKEGEIGQEQPTQVITDHTNILEGRTISDECIDPALRASVLREEEDMIADN